MVFPPNRYIENPFCHLQRNGEQFDFLSASWSNSSVPDKINCSFHGHDASFKSLIQLNKQHLNNGFRYVSTLPS